MDFNIYIYIYIYMYIYMDFNMSDSIKQDCIHVLNVT